MTTTAPLPADEAERLKVLAACAILDSPPEQSYDDLTQLAAYVCGTPMALVSLIDANRQWFKSRIGVRPSQTGREISFCAYTILRPEPLIVADTLRDPRFLGSSLVIGEPFIRFYAGVPLRTREGYARHAVRARPETAAARAGAARPAQGPGTAGGVPFGAATSGAAAS